MLQGNMRKLRAEVSQPLRYFLPMGAHEIALNPLLGHKLCLRFSGHIHCVACGRLSKKSFSQGYCYPCSQRLAACDICVMRPERCHYAQGTCREPAWGEAHCMQAHYVYLANSSTLKVGITRATQVPTRWIDQGAVQALAIFRTATRYHAGMLETVLARYVTDKTDWRRLLKSDAPEQDLTAAKDTLLAHVHIECAALHLGANVEILGTDAPSIHLSYPVNTYPLKIQALNFDKTPQIEGRLEGIKGQYLLFDCGVLNIRKFTGYEISLSHAD
jgi:hypothetical protein